MDWPDKHWLSFTGSRYSCTLLLGFGKRTELFHHSAVSSKSRGVVMMSCC